MLKAIAPNATKRKRPVFQETPRKALRSGDSLKDANQKSSSDILQLEASIFETKKNYNNITNLLEIARELKKNEEEEKALLATVSLCRIFTRLLAAGSLLMRENLSDTGVKLVHWLRDRLAEYRQFLLSLLPIKSLAVAVLTLSMKLLKAEGQYSQSIKEHHSFPKTFLRDIVGAICLSQVDPSVRKAFTKSFVERFVDARFYTYKAVQDILGTRDARSAQGWTFDAIFHLLASIGGTTELGGELQDFYIHPTKQGSSHGLISVSKHKQEAQEAWLALMRHDLDKGERKLLLGIMSRVIAPCFAKPELLMDFLSDSVNSGGSVSLLALSGVFYLMQERNLDHPAFYTKLYSLLDANILLSRHRSRFHRLLDTFLASSHLPAALIASFIKRLARLSLNAPPSALVAVIPWMYNLFIEHPITTLMLHRVPRTDREKEQLINKGLEDPFDPNEEDPMVTGAADSCIWEVVQLQSHYHPNVATIAQIVSDQFTKQFYCLEDFLDHSYGSLLESEMSKQIKRAPVVNFHIPKRIFASQDADSEVETSLLMKLWRYE